MAVKDYSTNPDENTTISGINIAEGCPPSGINNAIRQLMADVKQNADEQDSNVMTGATASAAGTSGNVPAPQAGEQDFFLRGDGTWAVSAGLPLGHIFTWPFSTPPDGSIIVNGSTYSRTLYADLWTYISSKSDWVKTESEWQSIASANGGFCPYYSNGDGSTTFRVPKFAPYQQIALSSASAGTYHEAGLPNITGDSDAVGFSVKQFHPTGVFKSGDFEWDGGTILSGPASGHAGAHVIKFDASDGNPIYGKSTTVQPESNEWIVCVVAYGRATNVGSVDVANVMSAVGTVQAEISDVLNKIMPVGAIYVQFAGQSAPADLFGGTWSNVSSSYAGLFFRAEGGNAAAFGSSQTGGLPNITGTFDRSERNGFAPTSGAFYNPNQNGGGFARDEPISSANVGFNASRCSGLYGASEEVRPVNSTIRIWKRTA